MTSEAILDCQDADIDSETTTAIEAAEQHSRRRKRRRTLQDDEESADDISPTVALPTSSQPRAVAQVPQIDTVDDTSPSPELSELPLASLRVKTSGGGITSLEFALPQSVSQELQYSCYYDQHQMPALCCSHSPTCMTPRNKSLALLTLIDHDRSFAASRSMHAS